MIGTTIVIQRRVPSQNIAQYKHWSIYTRERDAWFLLLRSKLVPREPVAEPVRMIIHSYRTRLVDYANLVGGAKAIPDCLIRLGLPQGRFTSLVLLRVLPDQGRARAGAHRDLLPALVGPGSGAGAARRRR